MALSVAAVTAVRAQECDVHVKAPTGQGPYDYRLRASPNIAQFYGLVVGAHFTASVRRGTSGNTTENPMGDLEYVLTRFPNHHEALLVVSKLQRKPGFKFERPGRRDYR